MAQFTFTDSQERIYSDVDGSPLLAVPGQSYELSVCPDDGRWSASQTTSKAVSAPATTIDDETPKETA